MQRVRPSLRDAVILALAVPWLAWAIVRLGGLDSRHPIVAAMAFTPYVAATSVLPVALALALRRWVAAALTAVLAVALLSAVAPRAFDGPQHASASDRGRRLVLMTFNTYEGRGDAEAVVRLAREHRVDVLSLQELTPFEVERLDAAGARRLLPSRVLAPRFGAGGSGLMARHRLRPVPVPSDPLTSEQPEAALELDGVVPLHIKAVHPRPPVSRFSAPVWQRALRALPGPRTGRSLRVLAGDFNATLDHRELRHVLDRGYVDAADAAGEGLRPTWPVGRRILDITIDHVLMPPRVRVRKVSVHTISGSDHRAVIAELVLPRD